MPFLSFGRIADRFSQYADEDAVARRFDGTLLPMTGTTDINTAEAICSHSRLANIEYGFRVLKSDIETAPARNRTASTLPRCAE